MVEQMGMIEKSCFTFLYSYLFLFIVLLILYKLLKQTLSDKINKSLFFQYNPYSLFIAMYLIFRKHVVFRHFEAVHNFIIKTGLKENLVLVLTMSQRREFLYKN